MCFWSGTAATWHRGRGSSRTTVCCARTEESQKSKRLTLTRYRTVLDCIAAVGLRVVCLGRFGRFPRATFWREGNTSHGSGSLSLK